ncbi:MAG: FAD-binding oxidoreductase [Actinobacteria bacterium]|nr:FAD-binding oxidoreductase [Actinomycetota bacterium]
MQGNEIHKQLAEAVGEEYVSTEPAILDGYAYQSFGNVDVENFPWMHRPVAVVLPSTTEEVQAVIKTCGRLGLKVKPFSTGWGAHAGVGGDDVVQMDLRRMDRILEIDEKNMVAVVEPYAICAQIQAEAMKKDLNLHIVGAGCGTSPLASCTSMDGTGWTGLTTGYNARNLLGTEWVLPDGELLRLGSLGSGAGWFCGDGPGPSLRGIMRGLFGARGALGVYTKCAIKLFPWNGPPQPDVQGTMSEIEAEIPDNFKVYICLFPSLEAYGDFAYGIGDAEIGFMICKNAIGLMLATYTPHLLRKVIRAQSLKNALNTARHMFQFMIGASSPGELEYQEKVLRRIAEETGGVLIDLGLMPEFGGGVWWGFVRAAMPPMVFRFGGMFGTSFGTCEAFDNCINQSRDAAELKQAYIDQDKLYDDFADNAWGGVYESTALYGHQEELALFDHRNPRHLSGMADYGIETMEISREKHYGVGLGAFMIDTETRDRIYGSDAQIYCSWQKKIKEMLDPDDVGDGKCYSTGS